MKILIDMNLSPAWVSVLEEAGHIASHWSTVGSLNASDREILLWTKTNGYLLFTHDLDFGAILAVTEERSFGVRLDFLTFPKDGVIHKKLAILLSNGQSP